MAAARPTITRARNVLNIESPTYDHAFYNDITVNETALLAYCTVQHNLGVAGVTTLNTLNVTGNQTVGGSLQVTGTTSLTGLNSSSLAVFGNTALSGNATISGTLGVTGTTTLAGLNSTALTVSGASILAALSSTSLSVSGNSTLTGNATVGGTLGVTGITTLVTLNATTATIPTINATTLNATTLNSTNVSNSGTVFTQHANVTGEWSNGASGTTILNGLTYFNGGCTVEGTLSVRNHVNFHLANSFRFPQSSYQFTHMFVRNVLVRVDWTVPQGGDLDQNSGTVFKGDGMVRDLGNINAGANAGGFTFVWDLPHTFEDPQMWMFSGTLQDSLTSGSVTGSGKTTSSVGVCVAFHNNGVLTGFNVLYHLTLMAWGGTFFGGTFE